MTDTDDGFDDFQSFLLLSRYSQARRHQQQQQQPQLPPPATAFPVAARPLKKRPVLADAERVDGSKLDPTDKEFQRKKARIMKLATDDDGPKADGDAADGDAADDDGSKPNFERGMAILSEQEAEGRGIISFFNSLLDDKGNLSAEQAEKAARAQVDLEKHMSSITKFSSQVRPEDEKHPGFPKFSEKVKSLQTEFTRHKDAMRSLIVGAEPTRFHAGKAATTEKTNALFQKVRSLIDSGKEEELKGSRQELKNMINSIENELQNAGKFAETAKMSNETLHAVTQEQLRLSALKNAANSLFFDAIPRSDLYKWANRQSGTGINQVLKSNEQLTKLLADAGMDYPPAKSRKHVWLRTITQAERELELKGTS